MPAEQGIGETAPMQAPPAATGPGARWRIRPCSCRQAPAGLHPRQALWKPNDRVGDAPRCKGRKTENLSPPRVDREANRRWPSASRLSKFSRWIQRQRTWQGRGDGGILEPMATNALGQSCVGASAALLEIPPRPPGACWRGFSGLLAWRAAWCSPNPCCLLASAPPPWPTSTLAIVPTTLGAPSPHLRAGRLPRALAPAS